MEYLGCTRVQFEQCKKRGFRYPVEFGCRVSIKLNNPEFDEDLMGIDVIDFGKCESVSVLPELSNKLYTESVYKIV